MKTRSYKNFHNQWVVETTTLLEPESKFQFTINTSKRSSGYVTTSASVSKVSDDGMSTTHELFSDYNKQLSKNEYKRATLKVLEGQHNSVNIDEVIADARAFYSLA